MYPYSGASLDGSLPSYAKACAGSGTSVAFMPAERKRPARGSNIRDSLIYRGSLRRSCELPLHTVASLFASDVVVVGHVYWATHVVVEDGYGVSVVTADGAVRA